MATGEYFSDSCGDMYTYYLKVGPGDVIEDVSYFTTGCGFGTATCSLLVELVRGKTVDEALAISDADIEAALGGYPEKKSDYPERSRLALQRRDRRLPGQACRRNDHRRDARAAARQRHVRLASDANGNGQTSQDENEAAGPRIVASDGGKLTISLR